MAYKRRRKSGAVPANFVGLLRSWVREFIGEPLLLAQESALILVLSTADLLLTYLLLRQGMQFYESNPVARWWFARWNMAGMTIFKFLVIGVAIVASEVVERRRPGIGRAVLSFGVVAVAVVVAYSTLLLYRQVGVAVD